MTINTKEDLNALTGTPEYDRFMVSLRGSLFNIYKEDNEWIADESNAVIERFGLTRADFEPIEQPVLPINETAEKIAARSKSVINKDLKRARDQALAALSHTLPNGDIVQVRPTDMPNFSIAIANGRPKDWVLSDNSVHEQLAVTEMQEAVADGIAQGEAIWQTYTDGLKAL